ncbi:MAG TPA: hypothetical protein VJU02_07950 [Nitrospiraceae bacterium]|nr:hypothetical protein [Nitrospiraceae bacterium]
MLVLIFIVGSMLFLQQSEGTAAENIGLPFEQSRYIHTQDASTDIHQHPVQGKVTSQKHIGGRPYSLFMHHAAGYFMLAIGILMAMDRATHFRQCLLQYATGVMWTLFGLFIFVRADPDGWPMGSGFWESWTMPTYAEWLQHKLLSLIPLLLAPYAFRGRPTMGQDNGGSYVAAGLVIIGAVGLLSHQHLDHPGLDAVNIQHRFFAGTCLLIAFSLLQEARRRWIGNTKKLIFPTLLILLSLQLVCYTE